MHPRLPKGAFVHPRQAAGNDFPSGPDVRPKTGIGAAKQRPALLRGPEQGQGQVQFRRLGLYKPGIVRDIDQRPGPLTDSRPCQLRKATLETDEPLHLLNCFEDRGWGWSLRAAMLIVPGPVSQDCLGPSSGRA
jgi:hypothetical protein